MFKRNRTFGLAVAFCAALTLSACGDESPDVGLGGIVLTSINLDGTIGPGCTVGAAGPFPTQPTEFAIVGSGFSILPSNQATIRFTAVGGGTPFLGGTSAVVEVTGTVQSDTLLCGVTPAATVCGVPSLSANVEVILSSSVRDDSTAATTGPVFTITFNAPVITMTAPPCVPSLTPVTFTLTGMFLGNNGDIVTVRFASAENLPAGDPIFGDGTTNTIDVFGTVGGGGTTVTGTTPKATNQVEGSPPGPANPLHRVSDPLEDASVNVFLANGSCTSGGGSGMTQFDAPEGDTINAPTLAVPTSIPQTIATPFVITGTAPAACPDGFAPIGGTVQVSFSAPGFPSAPANAFQLNAAGAGTANFDVVNAQIVSATTIVGMTPVVRATVDFVPVVRIHFEDGTIAPITTTFTWEAPPVITAITNLDVNTGNGFLSPTAAGVITQTTPTTDFLGCLSNTMQITGMNFDTPAAAAGPLVIVYDKNTGISRHLGTHNPVETPTGNDLGVPFTATATTITGETRLEGLLAQLDTNNDGLVTATVRVTNADLQWVERDVVFRTRTDPLNLTPEATFANQNANNSSVTIDPTSALDDFGQSANDIAFNANIAVVTGTDVNTVFALPVFQGTAINVLRSTDGGQNWTASTVGPAGSAFNDGFPAAALRNFGVARYDNIGNLWVSYLVDDLAAATSSIVLLRSADQGATWVDASLAGHPETAAVGLLDVPALAVGNVLNPATTPDQVAYVAWVDSTVAFPFPQVRVFGRRQAGLGGVVGPAAGPAIVNDGVDGAGNLLVRARPAVGPNGELYVAWNDLDINLAPPPPVPILIQWIVQVDRDFDGLFGPAVFDIDTQVDRVALGLALPSSPQIQLPPPLTDAIVVQSGTHKGRLVLGYEAVFPGTLAFLNPDNASVATNVSDTFGFTWSGPNVVHQVDVADQYMAALATDPGTGRCYITWYDTKNDPANLLTQRFSAASNDGVTWGAPLLLSIVQSSAPADTEITDYGLYSGVSALNGCVVAAWAESPAAAFVRKDTIVRLFEQN